MEELKRGNACEDLFAHGVNNLQVLGVCQQHICVHSNIIVQEGHHICINRVIHHIIKRVLNITAIIFK